MSLKSILAVITGVAVVAALFLARSNWQYAGRLAHERTVTKLAIEEAKAANAAAARAELAAQEAQKRADKQTAVAKAHADRARAAESRHDAPSAATSWRQAYESQLQATANLQAAVDTLVPALAKAKAASAKLQGSSQKLVDATAPSFWKRLLPHASLSVTAGVNPQGRPDAVAGVGLSWNLHK